MARARGRGRTSTGIARPPEQPPPTSAGKAYPRGPVAGFAQAADFHDSVGICHHPEYLFYKAGNESGQLDTVAIQRIQELGIRHVRLGLYSPANYGSVEFYTGSGRFGTTLAAKNAARTGAQQPIGALWGTTEEPAYEAIRGSAVYTITNTNGTWLRPLDGPAGTIPTSRYGYSTHPFASTSIKDGFWRSTLGANWSNDPFGDNTPSAQLAAVDAANNNYEWQAGSGGRSTMWWNAATYLGKVEAYATLKNKATAPGSYLLIGVIQEPGAGAADGYMLKIATDLNEWTIVRYTNGSPTVIAGPVAGATTTTPRRSWNTTAITAGTWSNTTAGSDADGAYRLAGSGSTVSSEIFLSAGDAVNYIRVRMAGTIQNQINVNCFYMDGTYVTTKVAYVFSSGGYSATTTGAHDYLISIRTPYLVGKVSLDLPSFAGRNLRIYGHNLIPDYDMPVVTPAATALPAKGLSFQKLCEQTANESFAWLGDATVTQANIDAWLRPLRDTYNIGGIRLWAGLDAGMNVDGSGVFTTFKASCLANVDKLDAACDALGLKVTLCVFTPVRGYTVASDVNRAVMTNASVRAGHQEAARQFAAHCDTLTSVVAFDICNEPHYEMAANAAGTTTYTLEQVNTAVGAFSAGLRAGSTKPLVLSAADGPDAVACFATVPASQYDIASYHSYGHAEAAYYYQAQVNKPVVIGELGPAVSVVSTPDGAHDSEITPTMTAVYVDGQVKASAVYPWYSYFAGAPTFRGRYATDPFNAGTNPHAAINAPWDRFGLEVKDGTVTAYRGDGGHYYPIVTANDSTYTFTGGGRIALGTNDASQAMRLKDLGGGDTALLENLGVYHHQGWITAGGLQGPNEPDNNRGFYPDDIRATLRAQKDALAARSDTPVMAGADYIDSTTGRIALGPAHASQLPVVGFHSIGNNWVWFGDYTDGRDIDVANRHLYWGGHGPSLSENTGAGMWGGMPQYAGLPRFVTETGYYQRPGYDGGPASDGLHPGWGRGGNDGQRYVPEEVAGEYLIRTLIQHYAEPSLNIRRTYLYKLCDESDGVFPPWVFGICDIDFNRRASFYAIRNLLALVGFVQAPTSQPITVTNNFTAGGTVDLDTGTWSGTYNLEDHLTQLVLQRSSAEYLVILSRTRDIWSRGNQAYRTVADPKDVVLTVPGSVLSAGVAEPAKNSIKDPADGQTYANPGDGQAYAPLTLTTAGANKTLTVRMAGLSRVVRLTLTPEPDPTQAPTGVTATASHNSVRVSWNVVAGATGYEVFRDGTQIGAV